MVQWVHIANTESVGLTWEVAYRENPLSQARNRPCLFGQCNINEPSESSFLLGRLAYPASEPEATHMGNQHSAANSGADTRLLKDRGNIAVDPSKRKMRAAACRCQWQPIVSETTAANGQALSMVHSAWSSPTRLLPSGNESHGYGSDENSPESTKKQEDNGVAGHCLIGESQWRRKHRSSQS